MFIAAETQRSRITNYDVKIFWDEFAHTDEERIVFEAFDKIVMETNSLN